MTAISVILIDAQPIVREGLQALFARHTDLHLSGAFATADAALAAMSALAPRIVVIDLPDGGALAIEAISRLRRAAPAVRVLVFTAVASGADMRAAVSAGALGFVLKTEPLDELLRAIRAVAEGLPWLARPVQSQLLSMLQTSADWELSLTPREYSVLQLVGAGHSNKQIALRLGLATGTVKRSVSRILKRLDISSRTQAALLASRAGLVESHGFRPCRQRTALPRVAPLG
jgi:DNA-binding NarL/FixJ family response regulator